MAVENNSFPQTVTHHPVGTKLHTYFIYTLNEMRTKWSGRRFAPFGSSTININTNTNTTLTLTLARREDLIWLI